MLIRIETLGVWRCGETNLMLPVAAGKAETKDGLEDVFLVALTPWELWGDVEVPPLEEDIEPDSPLGDRAQELWETENLPVVMLNRKWIGEYDLASKQGYAHRGRIEIRPAGREWWDEFADEPVVDIEKMMRGVEHLLERVADTILTTLWPEWVEAAEDARKREAMEKVWAALDLEEFIAETGDAFCAVELSQALGMFDGPAGEA